MIRRLLWMKNGLQAAVKRSRTCFKPSFKIRVTRVTLGELQVPVVISTALQGILPTDFFSR